MSDEEWDLASLKRENEELAEENITLRKQLRLYQENCSLRAATVFTSLLAWLDADKTRVTQTERVVKHLEDAIKSLPKENIPSINIQPSTPVPNFPFPTPPSPKPNTLNHNLAGSSPRETTDPPTLQEAYDRWASYRTKNLSASRKKSPNLEKSNQDRITPVPPNGSKRSTPERSLKKEKQRERNVKKKTETPTHEPVYGGNQVAENTSEPYHIEVVRSTRPQQVSAFPEVFESADSLSETSSDSDDQAVPKEWSAHGHIWMRPNQSDRRNTPPEKTIIQSPQSPDRTNQGPQLHWKHLLSPPTQRNQTMSPTNPRYNLTAPTYLEDGRLSPNARGKSSMSPQSAGASPRSTVPLQQGNATPGQPMAKRLTQTGQESPPSMQRGGRSSRATKDKTVNRSAGTERESIPFSPLTKDGQAHHRSQAQRMKMGGKTAQNQRQAYQETRTNDEGNISGSLQGEDMSFGYNHIGMPVAASTPQKPGKTNQKGREELMTDQDNTTANSIRYWEENQGQPFTHTELEDITLFLNNAKPNKRLIGEVAYQLDRRIITYVFNINREDQPYKRRFYGYTLQNIHEMIKRESLNRNTGKFDSSIEAKLSYRFEYILRSLAPLGYDIDRHTFYSADIVNRYGLLPIPTNQATADLFNLRNKEFIAGYLMEITPSEEVPDVMILFECLALLAQDEAKPLFIW